MTAPDVADILIVGSGPVGCAFARQLRRLVPNASIVMVEAGPKLTAQTGSNIRNLPEPQRTEAQLVSQAAGAGTAYPTSASGDHDGRIAARDGLVLLRASGADEDPQVGMPAAAMATNVGGMGAHWTCACPKPGGSERIPFIDAAGFDRAFDRAYELLGVTTTAFPETDTGRWLTKELSRIFDDGRSPDRQVQPMPLAARPSDGPLPVWLGPAAVLADTETSPRFTLLTDTVCLRLVRNGDTVTGAELVDRVTGDRSSIAAATVVVAADALRTPQLLWASGIRPTALGRYLNDQPQLHSALLLNLEVQSEEQGNELGAGDVRDRLTGVTWIPFDEPDFPFHTQVMQVGTAPIELAAERLHKHIVSWGRFTRKDIRATDRVHFADDASDAFGLPRMTIDYGLSDADMAMIERAKRDMVEQAASFGRIIPGLEPRLLPAGSSLHYQGSFRMGASDDGQSVCDAQSRVWGLDNLFLGGNGLIPTSTACNPTATSVALAVLASEEIARQL